MKTMKTSVKCLIAFFVMAMAFCVTGITAEAAATNLKQTGDSSTSVSIEWTGIAGVKYYGYQIATDPNFTSIFESGCSYSSTKEYINNLAAGSTYYVRVGYGTSSKDCYNDLSAPLEVVTTPGSMTTPKFVGADDNFAVIAWDAVPGATGYSVEYNNVVYDANTNSYALPVADGRSNSAYIRPYRVSSVGYKAVGNQNNVSNLTKLTTKISKDNFGIKNAYSNINVFYFAAIGNGTGYELEGRTVSGKKYTFKDDSLYFGDVRISKLKYSKMYKYRVRAYIITTDGQKVYGKWSDYNYICNPKKVKYTTSGKKIKLSWSNLTGVSKVKIQISTKENSGYKTCATLSGKKTSYTISKYGKSSLKKGKKYWVRITYQYKSGKKYYTSDVYSSARVTVR